jgi:hypothetical protein
VISTELKHAVRLADQRRWQLARAAGVHPTRLSKWVSGSEPPRPGDPRVIALGALFGIPPERCFATPESALVEAVS